MAERRPQSLRTELLFQLGFLASSAVLLTGLATALIARFGIEESIGALVVLWVGSSVVFVLFAHYLVRRTLLKPLETLAAEVTAMETRRVAGRRRTAYESEEFAQLAERYRRMAASLLDVNSQIVRVEKLAGVGQLAAGVAHEIRNPLGALHTYVEVLRRRGTDAGVTDAMVQEIERIEHIVRGLLDYSRPGPADRFQRPERGPGGHYRLSIGPGRASRRDACVGTGRKPAGRAGRPTCT